MELTTPQIYAIFAMLTTSALAALIFYCIGLRTGRGAGYELGRESATTHWRKLLDAKREANDELHERIAALRKRVNAEEAVTEKVIADCGGQIAALKREMHAAENDREGVIRDLTAALLDEYAKRLQQDDWLNLKLAAKQLGQAAQQFTRSGSTKTNQAAIAQASINALADRVKAIVDQPPRLCEHATDAITDTDLIEWLDREATYNGELEYGELRFNVVLPVYGFEHARDVLTLAVKQQRQRDYGQAMGAAA